jgi:hypothetical protein
MGGDAEMTWIIDCVILRVVNGLYGTRHVGCAISCTIMDPHGCVLSDGLSISTAQSRAAMRTCCEVYQYSTSKSAIQKTTTTKGVNERSDKRSRALAVKEKRTRQRNG